MAECSTGCGQPTQDMLCSTCLTHLVTDLRQIQTRGQMPGLYAELEVTLTRQDKLTTAGDKVKGQGETALMFNAAASEVKWVLDNTITTWARDVAETYPHRPLMATSTPEAAEWMADGAGLLAEHPAAKELHDEITDVAQQVRRIIDRPVDRVALGECGAVVDDVTCTQKLDAMPHHVQVHCPTCGTTWDTRKRQEQLARSVDDQLDNAATIAHALFSLGYTVTPAMIRGYAHRGKLTAHGPLPGDSMERPRYRVGDVMDLLIGKKAS